MFAVRTVSKDGTVKIKGYKYRCEGISYPPVGKKMLFLTVEHKMHVICFGFFNHYNDRKEPMPREIDKAIKQMEVTYEGFSWEQWEYVGEEKGGD